MCLRNFGFIDIEPVQEHEFPLANDTLNLVQGELQILILTRQSVAESVSRSEPSCKGSRRRSK